MFNRSPESCAIEKVLAEIKRGETLTRMELEQRCEFDPLSLDLYDTLSRVRDRMLRDTGEVFEIIPPRAGIRRLRDDEVVNRHAPARRRRAARQIRRGLDGLGGVDYNTLAPEDQLKHNAYAAGFGALRFFSSAKAVRKIEANNPPPGVGFAGTLEMFRSKKD